MKRDKFAYLISSLFLAGLVAMAFWVPQLLFRVQDAYHMQNIWEEPLEEMDTDRLSVSYETSLYQRLASFADGTAQGKKYFVAETDYMAIEVQDIDIYAILAGMLNTGYIYTIADIFYTTGNHFLYDDELMSINQINAWTRYVVYEEDFDNGVTLMMWYLDLELVSGNRIRVLIDTEDYTLYAMWVTNSGKSSIIDSMSVYREDDLEFIFRNYIYVIGEIYDLFSSPAFFHEESESADANGEYNGQENRGLQEETVEMKVRDAWNWTEATLEKVITLESTREESSVHNSFQMNYGNSLHLNYIISNEDPVNSFFIWGFEEIWNLIPQMQNLEK